MYLKSSAFGMLEEWHMVVVRNRICELFPKFDSLILLKTIRNDECQYNALLLILSVETDLHLIQ